MTMSRVPKTGQAVIIDIGEGKDIHPKNKLGVARRLARWALAQDYGYHVWYKSPTYKSMKVDGNKVTVHVVDGGGHIGVADTAAGQVQVMQLRCPEGVGDEAGEPPCAVVCQRALRPRRIQIGVGRQRQRHRQRVGGHRGLRPGDEVGHPFGEPSGRIRGGFAACSVVKKLVGQDNS